LATTTITPRSSKRERLAWIGFGVASLLALLVFGTTYFRRPTLEAEPMRLFVNPPEKATRFAWPTISPDGRTLAFIATVEGKTQLWVRPLNSTTAKPLADLGFDAGYPFWSPDNQYLAFSEGRKLKKIPLAGGTPETLCDFYPQGGTWNREGVILFGAREGGIKRISANGGAVTSITKVDSSRGETAHSAPSFLPDGRHFLFYVNNADPAKRGIYLGSLDNAEPKFLLSLNNPIIGIASNPAVKNEGYLVFVRQGALLAQTFDFSRNQLTGEPVRLTDQVRIGDDGYAQSSLSTNGVLVLIEGDLKQQLAWFDRSGKKVGTVGTTGVYAVPKLSPDGQRLAVERRDPQMRTSDILLFDLARTTESRFTFDPADDQFALWSPDNSRIVWSSNREGQFHFYQKAATGAGQDEVLYKSAYRKYAMDWSRDGRFILYWEYNPQTNRDLWVLPLQGEQKPWPWLNTPLIEGVAKFSPDGRWIAYSLSDAGRDEIYIQAFVPGAPAAGGKWQITTNGGLTPHWRRDGRELYYLSYDNKVMAVDVTLGAEVKAGTPKELFSLDSMRMFSRTVGYAKTDDGQRFLFVTSVEDASPPPFTVVLNWMAEMKK
jgi:Tol biopolymer transport system component